MATEIFKINKNCCLNELKSTVYINAHASAINVLGYMHALNVDSGNSLYFIVASFVLF